MTTKRLAAVLMLSCSVLAGGLARVFVADLNDLVVNFGVKDSGHETRADPLDLVRPRLPARQNG